MATTAQNAVFGFGPQEARGVAPAGFYRHKALDIDFGINDDTRLGPLEIGGSPFPTFPYKAGYVTAGGATIQPRLSNVFGWLCYAAMGDVSSAAVGATAAYDHTFKPLAADLAKIPWIGIRKYYPAHPDTPGSDMYEYYEDAKLLQLSFRAQADQPLIARMEMLGCSYEIESAPTWTWENTYEDYETIPVGCEVDGEVTFTGGGLVGETLKASALTVTIANNPLDIRQERNIGSPTLDDVTVVSRVVTYDTVVKWVSPALYKAVQTNAYNGTAWSAKPLTGSLAATIASPELIGATIHKHKIVLSSPDVMWSMEPVGLVAGQAVLMRLRGTALENAGNYSTIVLRNGQTGYTWPTP